MPSEIYKILTNSADYRCLACGTYNCNDGVCERCRSIQYGSPAYARSGLAARDRLLATLTPEQYAEYIAKEQRESRDKELKRRLEQEEEARRDARREKRDKQAEAARLAITLPLRARWEQQKHDEEAAWLRQVSRQVLIGLACVLSLAAAVYVILAADFDVAGMSSGLLGILAAAGAYARSRPGPQAPVPPSVSGSAYSRAPRSQDRPAPPG